MEPEVGKCQRMKRKMNGGEDEDKSVKRGCLDNAADSNDTNGAAKILSSFRQSKNVEGSLVSIASYVIFMEEGLHGLTVGPFLNSSYRNRWRKRLEEAASLSEVKAYLLEFERNIREVAFSSDWIRHVDDTGSESRLSQSAKSVVGSVKKPGRKPSVVIRKIPDVKDLLTDFAWWRGGMLSKHMIKRAAQQGGCKKINGVHYVDSHEVHKRSKQCIWRAAVDLSQTASELALQVSYLDLHVRWNELVYSEQPLQDGKGLKAEASAFRNACIVDKKRMGYKLFYGVAFENQKHLPSCVLKQVLKVEETGDKKSKNWFSEMHIPLYLIKEYEMVVAADVKLPESDIKHATKLSKLSKKQLKASGKNLFSFLEHKRENMGNVFCTFCQRDVSFGVAAKCSACQGYCHDECAVGTYNIQTASRIEYLVTCKRCYDIEKDVTPKNEIVDDSPTSPLLSQGQESQHSTSLIQVGKQNCQESQHLTFLNRDEFGTVPKIPVPKIAKNGYRYRYRKHSVRYRSVPYRTGTEPVPKMSKVGTESVPKIARFGKFGTGTGSVPVPGTICSSLFLIQVGKQNGQESQHSTSLKQNGHERPLECSNPISSQPEKGTSGKGNSISQPLQSVDQEPEVTYSSKRSKKKSYKLRFGVIWKKKNKIDTGTEFRENNIILKGNPFGRLLAPKCHLCKQPYNPELMYILCEKCENWFHADSVDLQESQIMEVFGYKCCKCRRIRGPICPHRVPICPLKDIDMQGMKNSEDDSDLDSETRARIEAKREANARVQMKKNLGYDFDLDPEIRARIEAKREANARGQMKNLGYDPDLDPETRARIEAKREASARAQVGYDSNLDPLRCFEVELEEVLKAGPIHRYKH